MDVIIVSASPNRDGLTAACAAAADRGVRAGGRSAEQVQLNALSVGMCQACANGWGTCQSEHRCQVIDDFQSVHARLAQADGLVLVTPVYFGQMSESAKALADRLRRCEATRGRESAFGGKPMILVAAAGGSGGGTITCLLEMERWAHHVAGRVFDLIPVNRWNRRYKLLTIEAASRAMLEQVAW